MFDNKPPVFTCADCLQFDRTKHILNPRTAHAGICRTFASVELTIETACNKFMHADALGTWAEVEAQNTPLTRIAEAKAIQTYLNL